MVITTDTIQPITFYPLPHYSAEQTITAATIQLNNAAALIMLVNSVAADLRVTYAMFARRAIKRRHAGRYSEAVPAVNVVYQ